MPDLVVIGSLISPLTRGQTTSATASSFAVADSRPTTTEPVASATRTVIKTRGIAGKEGVTLKVMPIGGDSDNGTVSLKVQGWNSVKGVTGATTIEYVARAICVVGATLSAALLGIATMPVVATEFFADDVTLTSGLAVLHKGTADVDAAWFECDVSSYEYVEIIAIKGTADRANSVYNF